jgi:hypothetical protein
MDRLRNAAEVPRVWPSRILRGFTSPAGSGVEAMIARLRGVRVQRPPLPHGRRFQRRSLERVPNHLSDLLHWSGKEGATGEMLDPCASTTGAMLGEGMPGMPNNISRSVSYYDFNEEEDVVP